MKIELQLEDFCWTDHVVSGTAHTHVVEFVSTILDYVKVGSIKRFLYSTEGLGCFAMSGQTRQQMLRMALSLLRHRASLIELSLNGPFFDTIVSPAFT